MISSEVPKISCVVLADKLDEDLARSFEAQVYPNKELIGVLRHEHTCEHVFVRWPDNLDENWAKDLAVEMATGELVCWWDRGRDPFYLSKRVREPHDDQFFAKAKFYEAQNMLYCGPGLMNKEYYEI